MTAEQLPAAAVVPCGFGGSVTSHDRQSRSGGGTDLEVEPEPAGVTADRGVGGAGGLRRSLAPVHSQVRQAPPSDSLILSAYLIAGISIAFKHWYILNHTHTFGTDIIYKHIHTQQTYTYMRIK